MNDREMDANRADAALLVSPEIPAGQVPVAVDGAVRSLPEQMREPCEHEETQVLHEELNWREVICTFCGETQWVVPGPLLDYLRTRT